MGRRRRLYRGEGSHPLTSGGQLRFHNVETGAKSAEVLTCLGAVGFQSSCESEVPAASLLCRSNVALLHPDVIASERELPFQVSEATARERGGGLVGLFLGGPLTGSGATRRYLSLS